MQRRDVVCAIGGSTPYTNSYQNTSILEITSSGKPSKPITFTSAPGSTLGSSNQVTLQIADVNLNGIWVHAGTNNPGKTLTVPSYIIVQGFNVVGNGASSKSAFDAAGCQPGIEITSGTSPCSQAAIEHPDSYPQYNSTCIQVDGRRTGYTASDARPTHISVLSNTAQECSAAGISVIEIDYVNVSYNGVWDSAFYTTYG